MIHPISVFLLLILILPIPAVEPTIPQFLQEISVTVRTKETQGSGVILLRGDTNFVLTAGHVIRGLRHQESSINEHKERVFFNDAEVVQELIEDGRKVGVLSFTAKVISYSKAEKPGEDLGLLQLYKKRAYAKSVTFYVDNIPPVGTNLFHCGSLLGQFGANSMTTGIISQLGRTLDDTVYDQTSCTTFPGSSGGGVFTTDGRYIGMVVRGAGEGFNFIVPVRRIRTWTNRIKAGFVFDEKKPITIPILEETFNAIP